MNTPMTTKESEVDVLAVMEDAARRIYVNAETQEDNDASDVLLKARAAVAEVFEAAKESIAEIERLRDAMFSVYAVAANGGNPTQAIEAMRDEMDKPWSVDRSRTALRNAGVKV